MKITIPSRVATAGTGQQQQQSPPSSGPGGRATIKIKQQQGAGVAAGAAATQRDGNVAPSSSGTATALQYPPPPSAAAPSSAATPSFNYPGAQQQQQQRLLNNGQASGESSTGKRKRDSLTPNAVAQGNQNASGPGPAAGAKHENPAKLVENSVKLLQTMRDFKKDGRTLSAEFAKLPPRDIFTDYYSTIKKPISFAEVSVKVDRQEYLSSPDPLKAQADDFHQMFVNAKRYNQKGSNIWNDAKRLDRLLKTTYTKITGGLTFDGFTLPGTGGGGGAAGGAGGGDDNDDTSTAAPTPSIATLPPPSYSAVQSAGPPLQDARQTSSQPSPKKKKIKEDAKPPTLTKWLNGKVDDLVALNDPKGRNYAEIFLQLPPPDQYPDYYQLIQRPVSFQLVRSRLKNRNYPTIQKFIDDVNAIFINAQYYNQEGSQVWQDSKVLQDYFAEQMKEPAPDFLVRPRNKDQQAVSSQYASLQQQGGPGQQYNNLRLNIGVPGGQNVSNAAGHDSTGQITLQMGQNGGIENIAFADEWDDSALMMEQDDEEEEEKAAAHGTASAAIPAAASGAHSQQQQPPKVDDIPVPQPGQPPQAQTLAMPTIGHGLAAQSSSVAVPFVKGVSPNLSTGSTGPRQRVISQLVAGQTPYVRTFTVLLASSSASTPVANGSDSSSERASIQHVLHNSQVRQHTLVCPKAIDRMDIIPQLSTSGQADIDTLQQLRVTMRPQHSIAEAPGSLGTASQHWLARPAPGLNVIEITTADGSETYRLFVNKVAA